MLKQATKACFDAAVNFSTPFISGKDSMFNNATVYNLLQEKKDLENNPVLLITGVGIINDIKNTVSPEIKFPDDLIYKIGIPYQSNYSVDIPETLKLLKSYLKALGAGLITSALAVEFDGGGITMTLIKKMLSSFFDLGIEATVSSDYNQQSIIVSINPKNKKKFEEIFTQNAEQIGHVTKQNHLIINDERFPKEQLLENFEKTIF